MKIAPMKVEYVDHMGSDLSVVNAARVSFHKQSEWVYDSAEDWQLNKNKKLTDKDVRLIHYLARHNHWTPFGHTSISLRIKAPIFVARQAGKHQVGLVWNEVSRRYVDDEPEFFFPKEWRGKPENAKQGSDGVIAYDGEQSKQFVRNLVNHYIWLLKQGIAPEQARMILPQNMMTEWIWTGSLIAFNRVCKLRLDPHSQLEIQELAGAIAGLVEPLFPVSWSALMTTE
jgi:thymidylate synthase (FAD)